MASSDKANASGAKIEKQWHQFFMKTTRTPPKKSTGMLSLVLSALSCLFLAGVFYLLFFWAHTKAAQTHKEMFSHLEEIFRHLSTAFIVALVSIVGIEINARRRAERELNRFVAEFKHYRDLISENVFQAVLGRIVPEQLTQEVNEILRSPYVKLSTQYIIHFFKPYQGMSNDYCVVRRDLSFTVENVTAEPQTFPLRSSYTSDENLKSANWGDRPFHLALVINQKAVPKEHFLTADKHVMEHPVELAPREKATIFVQSEEPMRLEANRSFYYQSTPVDSLEVIIDNNYPEVIEEIEVQMHHPGRRDVIHEEYRNRYYLGRAFLPGQGFEAIWRKTQESHERLAAARQLDLPTKLGSASK